MSETRQSMLARLRCLQVYLQGDRLKVTERLAFTSNRLFKLLNAEWMVNNKNKT